MSCRCAGNKTPLCEGSDNLSFELSVAKIRLFVQGMEGRYNTLREIEDTDLRSPSKLALPSMTPLLPKDGMLVPHILDPRLSSKLLQL